MVLGTFRRAVSNMRITFISIKHLHSHTLTTRWRESTIYYYCNFVQWYIIFVLWKYIFSDICSTIRIFITQYNTIVISAPQCNIISICVPLYKIIAIFVPWFSLIYYCKICSKTYYSDICSQNDIVIFHDNVFHIRTTSQPLPYLFLKRNEVLRHPLDSDVQDPLFKSADSQDFTDLAIHKQHCCGEKMN